VSDVRQSGSGTVLGVLGGDRLFPCIRLSKWRCDLEA